MKTFGPIYAKASNNKVKYWAATAYENGDLIVDHGYEDGKKTASKKRVTPKNVGKTNETTPYQQARKEAQSKLNKKLDEGYVFDKAHINNDEELLLPMLAFEYQKRFHDIEYPHVYVQPKLNGVRCITTYDGHFSRKGKRFVNLTHITNDCKTLIDQVNYPLDGEIFHPEWTFQEIVSALKNPDGKHDGLQYWIYDIVAPELTFEERSEILNSAFEDSNTGIINHKNEMFFFNNLIKVPEYWVPNEEAMKEKHKEYVEIGYEGTIIRNANGKYRLKHRSKDLQKYKDHFDSEYEIIGGKEATGEDAGTVVFICKMPDNDNTFSVRPKGSRELRKQWLNDIEKLKGKMLTVRYNAFSDEGIPINPRGVCIRDYE